MINCIEYSGEKFYRLKDISVNTDYSKLRNMKGEVLEYITYKGDVWVSYCGAYLLGVKIKC